MFFFSFGLKKVSLICLLSSSLLTVALVNNMSEYENTNKLIGRLGLVSAFHVCLQVSFIDIHWGALVRVY